LVFIELFIMYDIIILGSGPAGFTAGIYAVRAGRKTLLIAGSKWGGQLMLTTDVENFPGFADGIQGPQLMMNMRKQAERLGVEIVNSEFTKADFAKKPFEVTAGGKVYQSKSVIAATGADSIWLNVPGEKEFRGKGISACATCDAFFFRGKNVIIVGGGDSAMEEAHVLSNFASNVTIVHRRGEFRASQASQDMVLKNPKIKVIWNSAITKYNGLNKLESVNVMLNSKDGWLKFNASDEEVAVTPAQFKKETINKFGGGKVISSSESELVWELPVDGVFVAIGHRPNTTLYKGIELDPVGYIVRKEQKDINGLMKYYSSTSVKGVFTAGDVHDFRYQQAITASAYGCMAALDADLWLSENEK
jgi:thioredoxin reductase (NADPH)